MKIVLLIFVVLLVGCTDWITSPPDYGDYVFKGVRLNDMDVETSPQEGIETVTAIVTMKFAPDNGIVTYEWFINDVSGYTGENNSFTIHRPYQETKTKVEVLATTTSGGFDLKREFIYWKDSIKTKGVLNGK